MLICLGAGLLEGVLYVTTVRADVPDWNFAVSVHRLGIVTSLAAIVAGVSGLRQKPKGMAVSICIAGVAIGILGLVATLFLESLTHMCVVCL